MRAFFSHARRSVTDIYVGRSDGSYMCAGSWAILPEPGNMGDIRAT